MLEAGTDPRLPALAAWSGRGDLIVHRAGRRAVLFDGTHYLKLDRGDARSLAVRMEGCGDRAARAGFRTPHVRFRAGVLALSALPGTPLLQTSGQAWMDGLRAWAERWPGFVRSPVGDDAVHDGAAEQAVLERWVRRTELWHRLPASVLAAVFEGASAMLTADQMPLGVAHRDLHDIQLLISADEPGLLDFDTSARAEPALDLANLAVHLDLRHEQGLLDDAARRAGWDIIFTVADTLRVPRARWDAYALSARLRLACVYSFRPRWQQLAQRWMRELSSRPHDTITRAGWDG